ncbi:hypothetical protein F4806DRAFT_479831 [Annulohypoxylon nitens]|nr:hypothetical protein F4806DRAFT_479831 [Annulohypoxylon nitens]
MPTQTLRTLRALISRLFRQKPLIPVIRPVQPVASSSQNQVGRWSKLLTPHGVAWRTTFEPIELMLNEPDPVKKKQITEKWVKNMESHLNVTIITSSIVSSIMASAFSWASFSEGRGDSACIHIVKAIWYGAILISVSSIAAASQQITSIHRLNLFPDGYEMIHELLGESIQTPASSINGRPVIKLRLSQAFLWQIPVMLLNGSLYLFTVGLCILTYWDFTKSFAVSVEAVQILGISFFTICVVGAIGPWGISSIGLYHWIGNMLEVHT